MIKNVNDARAGGEPLKGQGERIIQCNAEIVSSYKWSG
jgi:hypothetical protein